MTINIWVIVLCGVISLIIGSIWYGPVFGKKWMQLMGADKYTEEEMKEKTKGMWKLYVTQFVLVLLQVYILAMYIRGYAGLSGIKNALLIWLGFIMPTIAGSSLWGGDNKKDAWARFGIMAGYNLILFIIFGYVLSF